MKCPVCGKPGIKEARQCPSRKGDAVCAACCRKCEYRGKNENPCTFHFKSPEAKLRQELAQAKCRADFLRRTADRLWDKGQSYAASQKEAEWRFAVENVKELEGELNERN